MSDRGLELSEMDTTAVSVGEVTPADEATTSDEKKGDEGSVFSGKYPPSVTYDSSEEVPKPVEMVTNTGAMVLRPSTAVLLEFRNLGLVVPLKKKFVHRHDATVEDMGGDRYRKHILRDVTGYVRPGELVAVMGASGAGKSSLLNVLARRNCQNSGDVLVNGQNFSSELQGLTAYVQQDDILMGNLTFQARLRMDPAMSTAEKYKKVDALIASLSLQKCADQQIGAVTQNLSRGISGGERKRVAFASEIITDPSLLFADEPTSGLDSFMAESVTRTLRALADNGRTVVCTIHQPSSEVYALFDRIILMSEGRVAYFGSRDGAIPYFRRLGYPCPTYSNPADYFINVLAVPPTDITEPEARDAYFLQQKGRVKAIEDAWATQYPGGKTMEEYQRHDILRTTQLTAQEHFRAGVMTQIAVLTHRAFLSDSRDRILSRARFGQSIILGVLLGFMYFQLENDQESIQNISGAVFFILINQSMMGTFGVLQTFPLERPIFQREYENGNYGLGSYYMSKVVAQLPMQIFFPSLFIVIGYWLIGLRPEVGVFLAFTGIVLLTSNAAMSMGYAISSAVPNVDVALAIGPLVLLPFLLFGGFFLNTESIPVYFRWLEQISFFKYGFSSLSIIIWDGVTDIGGCTPGNSRCVTTGAQVLDLYGFSPDDLTRDVWALVILVIAFRLIALIALWLGTKLRKQNESSSSGNGCCARPKKAAAAPVSTAAGAASTA